jgi:hypothetical protein
MGHRLAFILALGMHKLNVPHLDLLGGFGAEAVAAVVFRAVELEGEFGVAGFEELGIDLTVGEAVGEFMYGHVIRRTGA